MMTRLFMLREHKNGPVAKDKNGKPFYFSNKMNAKGVRDTLNENSDKQIVVSIGPDHRNYKEA